MKNLGAEKFLSLNFLNRFSSYIFPIIVFSLAFYLQYSVALLGLDLHHDLLMFDAARNFYSGQIPYKDFFYQYNLGTVFLHGAALGVLGLKIASLKKITVLFYALIALLIYLSCAIEGSRRSGFLLSVLWALLSPFYMPAMNGYHAWSTIYMMFACMSGLLCLQIAVRKDLLVFSLLAGAFFCLAFWFKQVAVFQIIAIVIWLVFNIWLSLSDKADRIKYIKIFSGFTIGCLFLSIPFFSYLYAESAILNWWIDAFQFNKYFSADSQNATGINQFLALLFPIQRDMGYRSFIWAILPFTLIVTAFQIFICKQNCFSLTKLQKVSISLFIFSGLAGWVEYFPLPHPFHTQMFMAPTFVAIGLMLGKHTLSFSDTKKHFLSFLVIYIFIGIGCYESFRHIAGVKHKVLNYKNDSIEVNLGSSADGLKLRGFDGEKLAIFYQNMMDLKTSSKSDEFIPLSVDPLRGLVPDEIERPRDFKMGLDWTWPNEIVEPGFSGKINSRIMLRQQPIYADSLIFIPGYKPIALLEMRAPISSLHTLYIPQAIVSRLIMRTKKIDEILHVTNSDFDLQTKSILFNGDSEPKKLDLIPLDGLSAIEIKSIKNIHISAIQEDEFPRYLSTLQMRYLEMKGKNYNGDLPGLYILDDKGGGALRDNINREDKKNLAILMLSSGKFFVNQNRPGSRSTLASLEQDRPIVVGLSGDGQYVRLLWSIKKNGVARVNGAIYKTEPNQLYLAVLPIVHQDESQFFVVQIEMMGGKTLNYFYAFENG